MKPRLIVEQKITPFANKYAIYSATEDGGKADLLAFAQQKRIAFKEKVTFYKDEQKTSTAFSFHAEKVMDVHGRYFVEDGEGRTVGAFRKEFKRSLINSTWKILDTQDKPLLKLYENSQWLASFRRFGGFIPYIGEFVDIIVGFFRYHFVIADEASGQPVGRYQKTTLFRDHYLLSMTDEAYNGQDWRVLAAMAVGLDALQSR